MDKKQLRSAIAAQKRALTPAQIEAASKRLTARLCTCTQYQNARSIYVYLSYNQEVRTDGIIRRAIQDGKRVAVPKVINDEMVFLWLDDPSAVEPGFYGIPEPIANDPIADDESAMIVMPGLAFDPQGHRIGYGGGFYDRYLGAHPQHPLVALCYDFQLMEHLEVESHDVPVELVIAEPV